MTALVKISMGKRIGATVLAPDGLEAIVWSYTSRVDQFANLDLDFEDPDDADEVAEIRTLHLWRDGRLLAPIGEYASRDLEVVSVHPIYQPGRRDCTKRNEHIWPDSLTPEAACSRCGLSYSEFQEPTDD